MSDHAKLPERLWKYRRWNDNTRAMIVDGDIYFAAMQKLNDPFEFRWREKLPIKAAEIDQYARALCESEFPLDTVPQRRVRFDRLKAEMHSFAAGRKDGIAPTVATIKWGVFCLSEVPDDILMWSHYAGNHSGVCVGIRPDKLKTKKVLPVVYSERVPLMDAWDYIRGSAELFVNMSLTKAAHWSYEKEWRTVDKPGVRRFAGCVDRVIIGALADGATRAAVREAVAGQTIEILQAKLSDTYYSLDILPEKKPRIGSPNHRNRRKSR